MLALTRRSLMLGATVAPFAARAQGWPSGLIRIVVPFPAGGSVDAIARLLQPGLQQRLGANVIIENRPGGSGSIGAAGVAKATPDGSSWLFVFDTHAVNPALMPNLPFDSRKDLEPVLLIGTAPHVLATHPSRPYRTLGDVINAAKGKPTPRSARAASDTSPWCFCRRGRGWNSYTCLIAAAGPPSTTPSPAMWISSSAARRC